MKLYYVCRCGVSEEKLCSCEHSPMYDAADVHDLLCKLKPVIEEMAPMSKEQLAMIDEALLQS